MYAVLRCCARRSVCTRTHANSLSDDIYFITQRELKEHLTCCSCNYSSGCSSRPCRARHGQVTAPVASPAVCRLFATVHEHESKHADPQASTRKQECYVTPQGIDRPEVVAHRYCVLASRQTSGRFMEVYHSLYMPSAHAVSCRQDVWLCCKQSPYLDY